MRGIYIDKFFHKTGNSNIQPGPVHVIDLYTGAFPDLTTAVTIGVHPDRYLPLAAGRDPSRTGDRRAPSAGFYFFNDQRSISLVLQDKAM
jgi:hypothetical protein